MERAEIERLLTERDQLRRRQRYAEADVVRAQLREAGVLVQDSRRGTRWRTVDHQQAGIIERKKCQMDKKA